MFELRGAAGTVRLVRRALSPNAPRAPEGLVRAHARRDPQDVETLLRMGEALRECGALGHSRPPDATELAWLIDRLEDAIARGSFVLDEPVQERRRVAPPAPKAAPVPKPAPPPKSATQLHSFSIRFVDEVGEGIGAVPITIRHATAEELKTAGSGVARVDDSLRPVATATVDDIAELKKALKPKWSKVRQGKILTEADGVTVADLRGSKLPAFDLVADQVRIVSIQPYVSRVRLIGGFFETNRTFLLPRGLAGARSLSSRCGAGGAQTLLLVGHTDTAGTPAFNDALSLDRAESLEAFLTHDVDSWLDWYGAGKSKSQRWGTAEDRAMLGELPDAATRDAAEDSVTWFQRTRGLGVDGKAGPETRRALILEYMALGGAKAPSSVEFVTHGCGENFPIESTGDGADAPDDRRVEGYFFDKDLGVLPPPKGKNSRPGSLEYDEWQKRAKATEDHDTNAGDQVLVLRILLGAEQARSMGDEYVLDDEDEAIVQRKRLAEATAGADGFPQLRYENLPEGRAYRLQRVSGSETSTVFDYTTIPELQVRFGTATEPDEPSDELLALFTPEPATDNLDGPALGAEDPPQEAVA